MSDQDNGIPKEVFARMMGCSVEELEECIDYGPYRGEVGYKGDDEGLLEYPCNCKYCQEEYNDWVGAGKPEYIPGDWKEEIAKRIQKQKER